VKQLTGRVTSGMLTIIMWMLLACNSSLGQASVGLSTVEQWGIEEITVQSQRTYNNPFKDVQLQARFTSEGQSVLVSGFYDGKQTWRIRFMPQKVGKWTFTTISNDRHLNHQSGGFLTVKPSVANHGLVQVAKTFHFSYADHTPYFLLGTTLYNWLNRDEVLQTQTLETLSKSPFTKVRFGLFPKWYEFNRVEPSSYPYVESAPLKFDLDRFNPEFFQHVEKRLDDLERLGIEADIILFHPYDHLGFATMDAAHDDAYIQYVTARLSAYRNVWWTMANEYDLFDPASTQGQKVKDWDRMFRVLQESDPYGHLQGIHNIATWYDHSKPWVTHAIIQDGTGHPARRLPFARKHYGKPTVVDEFGYEGNNGNDWGGLTGQEEIDRHWEITMAGGYASHGETYVHPDGTLWWAVGGELVGDSPARLGFLKAIMTVAPYQELEPSPEVVQGGMALALKGQYYLIWMKSPYPRPSNFTEVDLAGSGPYQVDLIDPWLMKTYRLGLVRGGLQAFRTMVTPSLLRFTKVSEVESGQVSDTVHMLLAKWIGDPNHGKAPVPVPIVFGAQHYSTEVTLGEILADPKARALVDQYLPQIPRTGYATALTLEQMGRYLGSGEQSVKLAQLVAELVKLELPQ
jgi:hypothetical protein